MAQAKSHMFDNFFTAGRGGMCSAANGPVALPLVPLLQFPDDSDALEDLRLQNKNLLEEMSRMKKDFKERATALARSQALSEAGFREKIRCKAESILFLRNHIIAQDKKIQILEAHVNGGPWKTSASRDDEKDTYWSPSISAMPNNDEGNDKKVETPSPKKEGSSNQREATKMGEFDMPPMDEGIAKLKHEKLKLNDKLQETLSRASRSLTEAESGYLDQIAHIDRASKCIIRELEDRNTVKDQHICALEEKVRTLQENIVRLEARMDLNEIAHSNAGQEFRV